MNPTAQTTATLPEIVLSAGPRILILAAHPDDEVVGFCTTAARAQQAGAEIYVYFATDGCIAARTLWPWQRKYHTQYVAKRRHEAETVANFLSYKIVGWGQRPARYLWRELSVVYEEICEIVKNLQINQIWLPAYEGGNADHDGLNAIGKIFKSRSQISEHLPKSDTFPKTFPMPVVLEFAEYNWHGQKARAQTFPYPNGSEYTLILTPDESAHKTKALQLYASEQQNLNYVGKQQECFRPLADYNYTAPPHEGTLWYAKYQWVPFKHPRVDFTQSNAVCLAITAFLQKHLI